LDGIENEEIEGCAFRDKSDGDWEGSVNWEVLSVMMGLKI
jgi:hypothetical protein